MTQAGHIPAGSHTCGTVPIVPIVALHDRNLTNLQLKPQQQQQQKSSSGLLKAKRTELDWEKDITM